jgi:hypothetical protein
MDEQRTDTPQPQAQKEWQTPELIFEEVKEVTRGGRGDERNLAREDKVTTYYHS